MRPSLSLRNPLVFLGLFCLAASPAAATADPAQDFIIPDYSQLDRPMTTIADAPWQVIYLNFDGATLQQGPSNAPNNTTALITSATLSYPAFASWSKLGGKDAGIKAVGDKLKIVYGTIAAKFVTTRPSSGDYTMAMIGGDGQGCAGGGAAIGVAPLDCAPANKAAKDNANKNDIVLIFGDKIMTSGSPSLSTLVVTIAHELGHSFGLEHITDMNGIMAPSTGGNNGFWTTSATSGGTCRKDQDAEKVLQDALGQGKQDTMAPRLWFVRPGEGAVLPPDFSFEVVAADDLGVHHVVVLVDGKKELELTDPPFTSVLRKLADGQHTIKATAHDWIGNKTEAQVTVTVNGACVKDGSCSGGAGGLGQRCAAGPECATGICALKEAQGSCVDLCVPGDSAVCPTGLTCKQTGEQSACLPGDGYTLALGGGDEGGCRLGPDRPPAAPLLGWLPLMGIFALLLLARRAQPPQPSSRSRTRRMRIRPSS